MPLEFLRKLYEVFLAVAQQVGTDTVSDAKKDEFEQNL